MFDPFAQSLFENLPEFKGLTPKKARRMLSLAYLAVIQYRTSGDTKTLPLKVTDYLRRLADTIEFNTVLTESSTDSVRHSGAFVAAESLALLSDLYREDEFDDLQVWPIQHPWVYTRIESALLYLIAGYDACASGVVSDLSKFERQPVDTGEEGSSWCFKLLVALCQFQLNPLPTLQCPCIFSSGQDLGSEGLENDTIGRLYGKLGESLALFLHWLSGKNNEGLELSIVGLRQIIRMIAPSETNGFIPGVGGDFGRVSHLAALLCIALPDLGDRALTHILPTGPGFTSDQYGAYLNVRANGRRAGDSGRPVLWPSAKAYVDSCVLGLAKHAVVSMPTGSGKSFVAELAISQAVGEGWCLYLAPTNALTEQIRGDLRSGLKPLKTEVLAFIGDQEYSVLKTNIIAEMPLNSVAVMTPEKASLALRLYPEVFSSCQLVVFDECHLLGEVDSGRGVTAELVLCQLMLRAPDIRILLMSAMVQNPDDLAEWLQEASGFSAKPIQVPWRPTRTLRSALGVDRESVETNYSLAEKKLMKLPERRKNEKFKALYSIACGLQGAWQSTKKADYGIVRIPCEAELLVTRKKNSQGKFEYYPDADKWVNNSSTKVATFLADNEIQTLVFNPANKHYPFSNASNTTLEPGTLRRLNDRPPIVKICQTLAEYEFGLKSEVFSLIRGGISVHTAHMLESEKIASEAAFRARSTRIMFATGTLAQGLNLPATAVVIAGTRIGDPRGQDVKVVEQRKLSQLLNAAGRAGRAGFANQGLVIAVPDEPFYLNEYEEVEEVKKSLGYLQQADNAIQINSGLESFLDQIAENVLDTDTASEVELQAIAALAGGDKYQAKPANIIQKSFASFQRRKRGKIDDIEIAAEHLITIRDSFTGDEHVPVWVPIAAQRAGLDFFLTVAIVNAWARVRKNITEDMLNWSVLEWTEELLQIIQYIPPKTLLRHFAIKAICRGSKKLKSFEKQYAFHQIGDRNWKVDQSWCEGWEEVKDSLWPWMAGEPLISIATIITGKASGEITSKRTAGAQPIPKTIALVNELFSSLSLLGGGLLAVAEQLFKEFADQGNAKYVDGIPLAFSCMPMCIKYGCNSPESLAWYRFGLRLRRPARLLETVFPPPPLKTDEELRDWVRNKKREWLKGDCDDTNQLFEKNKETFTAIESFIRGVN